MIGKKEVLCTVSRMSIEPHSPKCPQSAAGLDEVVASFSIWNLAMVALLAIAMVAVLSDSEAARRGREAGHVIESSLIDINSASLNELDSLPGIGPALAQAIFQARPFDSVEELARVHGIGRKTIERLRPLIQTIQVQADSGQASNHKSR